ncbi:MAG: helix-turn-helix transcriptional regulator [Polyangiales bacterium]
MRRRTPSELLEDPIGGYVQGKSFMVWVQSPTRFGATHQSPLEQIDQATATALFGLLTHPRLTGPFELLHDFADVQDVDSSAFTYAETFIGHFADVLAARTRRLAVVRPSGLAGAAFSGLFHDWVQTRFDAMLCRDRSEAYDWLGIDGDDRKELEALQASFSQPELLRRLRGALAADLRQATVERMARALSVSGRSLQRHMAECGTSFSDELARARVLAAEALLIHGTVKIEAIARDIGFRSPAAFTSMFGRIRGESPSSFRERHRRPTTED